MEDQWSVPGDQAPDERPAHDRGRDVRLVAGGVVLVLLVWFAVANLQDVKIRFWVTTTAAPLIVVVALSGFLGAAAFGLWTRLRRRRRAGGADRP